MIQPGAIQPENRLSEPRKGAEGTKMKGLSQSGTEHVMPNKVVPFPLFLHLLRLFAAIPLRSSGLIAPPARRATYPRSQPIDIVEIVQNS
jgi:hypothetical protein